MLEKEELIKSIIGILQINGPKLRRSYLVGHTQSKVSVGKSSSWSKVSVGRVEFSEWDASEQDDGRVAPSCSWIPSSTPFHTAPFKESSCAAINQKQGFNSFF